MSNRICGHATLVLEDCRGAQYAYGSYNADGGHTSRTPDGTIYIAMSPVIGACEVTGAKPATADLDYDMLFETGTLSVENCSNCRETTPRGVDTVAMRLVSELVRLILRDGRYPPEASYKSAAAG